jgi:hypothetical protein
LIAEVGERGVSPVTGEPYILLTLRDGCTHAVCRLPWDRIRPATRDEISRYRKRRSKG